MNKRQKSWLAVSCAEEAWGLWEDGQMHWRTMLRILKLAKLQKLDESVFNDFSINENVKLFLQGEIDAEDLKMLINQEQQKRNLLRVIDLKQPRQMYRAK